MTDSLRDKIRGCYLLGACGDALGAPLEGLRSLDAIIGAYGPRGLQDIVEFKNAYEKGLDYPAGRITDDTTMAMSTAAALVRTCGEVPPHKAGFAAALRRNLWQAYTNWGLHQDDGDILRARADEAAWGGLARSFWFACGAGRGTIAALMQPKAGSLAAPLAYDETIRGRRVKGPNAGCGGMMRVAPLAFLPLPPEKLFVLACESAAVTHGNPAAYVATGAVALLVHYAAAGCDMPAAIAHMRALLVSMSDDKRFAAGVAACLPAIDLAVGVAKYPPRLAVINLLPTQLRFKNPFLAVPVLAQAVYALAAGVSVKEAVVLSANHSGDLDSVAAIVGNVLGARHGMAGVPSEWGDMLLQRAEILAMADAACDALQTRAPKPSRRPRP